MIYIHVPFCRSFCVYCDFYSEIACRGKDRKAMEAYAEGLCREAEARVDEIKQSLGVNTLYIGGGTPSVLPLDVLERIVRQVKECAGVDSFEEFTIEVNPEDIIEKGSEYVQALLQLGVTRVSMGVQSLDDKILKWMGRRHDSLSAIKATQILRAAGVQDLSLDLIIGISQLSNSILQDTLERILALHPQHISSYQLSIEEGSALESMVSDGRYIEASEEQCRAQYDMLCERLSQAGYEHYEISNWALPGFRAKHNYAYWTRAPYVGLGPGAHSLKIDPDAQYRSWNSEQINEWHSDGEVLSEEEIREERIMLGLRTAEGIDGRRIAESDWFVSDSIIADLI